MIAARDYYSLNCLRSSAFRHERDPVRPDLHQPGHRGGQEETRAGDASPQRKLKGQWHEIINFIIQYYKLTCILYI
jgi:hypothetical protein